MKELINRLLEAGKLDAETAKQLTDEATQIDGKLKSARDESIDRRNKLKEVKSELDDTKTKYTTVLEQLGLDADEDIDMNDIAEKARGKTQADAQKDVQIKRLEKELEKVTSERDGFKTENLNNKRKVALSKAMQKHEWIDSEIVEAHFAGKIEVTEDGVYMKDGQTLEDGIAKFAADKPHLIKAQGQGGSGYEDSKGGKVVNPWSKETRNLTEQGRLFRENPVLAQQLKTQAGA